MSTLSGCEEATSLLRAVQSPAYEKANYEKIADEPMQGCCTRSRRGTETAKVSLTGNARACSMDGGSLVLTTRPIGSAYPE